MIGNRLITQGLGPSRGEEGLVSLITLGAGGVPTFVVETLEQVRSNQQVRYGGSSSRKSSAEDLTLAIAWAKLVGVNGIAGPNVQGKVAISHNRDYVSVAADLLSVKARKVTESVKVFVSRVYRR